MSRIKSSISGLRDRIDGMPLRQRALLAIALIALVFLVVDALMIRPQSEMRISIQSELDQAAERTKALNRAVEQLARQASENPDEPLREQLARVESRIATLESELQAIGGGLARPEDAMILLEQMLIADDAVHLDRMEKLAAEPLMIDESPELRSTWIHRFRLELRGPWNGLLGRLEAFENLPAGLYLESMQIESNAANERVLELVVYTLTLDEDWLDV